MNTKHLVLPMIALSFLAVPATAEDYYGAAPAAVYQSCVRDRDGTLQITGDQMTDSGMAGNAIRTGSFVRPKDGVLAACAREDAGYNAPVYGHRHRDNTDPMNNR